MKYNERNFTRTVHVVEYRYPVFTKNENGMIDYSKTTEKSGTAIGITAEQFPAYVAKYNLSPMCYIVSERDALLVVKEQALYKWAVSNPDTCKFVEVDSDTDTEEEEN